jgi:hypothetical protein
LQQLAQSALWRDEGRETAADHSIDCHHGLAASRPRHRGSSEQRPCRRRRDLINTNGACIDISRHFSAKTRIIIAQKFRWDKARVVVREDS